MTGSSARPGSSLAVASRGVTKFGLKFGHEYVLIRTYRDIADIAVSFSHSMTRNKVLPALFA